jgi:hypothetical protein
VAQQSALPEEPQVGSKPLHEGGASHVFVVVLQVGFGELQSALDKHPTHFDVAPRSLHFGVPPAQAAQLAPQAASALHTEHTPAPPQAWLLAQSASVDAYVQTPLPPHVPVGA